MSGLRQTLDQLDALRKKATDGPWQYDPETPGEMWDVDLDVILGSCENSADAALIVALRNHTPALIAAVQAAADLAEKFDAEAEHRELRSTTYPPSGPWAVEHHRLTEAARHQRRAAARLRAALAAAVPADTEENAR